MWRLCCEHSGASPILPSRLPACRTCLQNRRRSVLSHDSFWIQLASNATSSKTYRADQPFHLASSGRSARSHSSQALVSMTHRHISGLLWAKHCARPSSIPQGRPRGVKLLGLQYEASVARAIPGAKAGQWFEFADVNGLGWCQPDVLLAPWPGGPIVVVECKLSDVPESITQISALYRPVVCSALGRPVFGLRIAKYLRPDSGQVVRSLGEAFAVWERAPLALPLLHWSGRLASALVPPPPEPTRQAFRGACLGQARVVA